MIAPWMLAASVFALLAGGAALAAERVQRARGRASRGVWACAVVAAIAWPVLVPIGRSMLVVPPTVSGAVVASPLPMSEFAAPRATASWWDAETMLTALREAVLSGAGRVAAAIGLSLDTLLLLLWGATSVVLLWQLGRAARRVRAITAAATPMRVDGAPVLLSATFGPATVGWRTPQVVVPAWVLTLDGSLRALVLRHEQEHCRAHDPRAMYLAALAVALVPWNVGVWWMVRRWRLAIELDCDARTLQTSRAASPSMLRDVRRTYSTLLLFMTQQRVAPDVPWRLAPSLAWSRSHLHTRIRTMQQQPVDSGSRAARRQRMVFGVLALAGIAAACGTDIPGSVTPPDLSIESRSESPIEVVAVPGVASIPMPDGMLPEVEKPYFEFQVERPAAMMGAISLRYPPMLRTARVEGRVLASFVVGADGRVDLSTFKALRSDHRSFTDAVRQALETAKYQAAEVGGRKVAQVVQQPFVFALGMSSLMLGRTRGAYSNVVVTAWDGRWRSFSARMTRADSLNAAQTQRAASASRGASPDTYFEFQVDEPASMQSGANLRYGIVLRNAGIEGTVLAQFVLNTDGRIDPSTFKVLKTDHEGFVESVREALPRMRYTPARKDGRAVRQVVQQPFVFSLAK